MSDPGIVLLFGRLKDAFGAGQIALPDKANTVARLRLRLAEQYPELAGMIVAPSVRVAVNQELVVDEDEMTISSSDEIALLPPLSGG